MHQSVDAHPSIPRRPTARGPLSLIIKHSELQANVSAGPTITSRAALSSLTLLFFIIFFHGGACSQRLVITNPLSYFSAPFHGRRAYEQAGGVPLQTDAPRSVKYKYPFSNIRRGFLKGRSPKVARYTFFPFSFFFPTPRL